MNEILIGILKLIWFKIRITNGLCYIHKANIVHRDLILGISKSLDINSNSFAGGMYAYSDPEYLRNSIKYKRDKASDIYSLGVLFWELSSGRPPFDNKLILEILEIVKSEDYIKIYSNSWKDNPKQRPTIENIFDSLENIQFENIYYNSNENNQYIQIEVYTNNQYNFSSDSESVSSSDDINDALTIGGEIAGPFVPWLINAMKIIGEIFRIFINAQYNLKTCKVLVKRVNAITNKW
ncbi:hypothetical protein Glove_88g34 [Diversispora epigaea]|uniref:Protein kinase domain-containing protein n=1 Tax=Diversispora epigaea TaxID=1348612 RepID=A0A397J9I6_9GLOM|nr:hypothetical protein Glove_88g34 [Diversispora epigaea]